MPLLNRNGVFYADFRRRGGGLISCRTRDKLQAEQEYARLQLALAEGRAVTGMVTGTTLGQAFDMAEKMQFRKLKSSRTLGFHRKAIASAIPEDTPLADISVDHASTLVAALEGKGNGLATINRTMQTLTRVLGLAVEWRMLDSAPKLPRFKESRGRIRVIDYAEEKAICAEFERIGKHEMALLVTLLIDTGLRLGEYLHRERMAYHKAKSMVELWETKAGTGRTVPLTPRAAAALEALLATPKLTKDQIESRWQTMRRNIGMAGDKQFVIHALRHTCCTRLWQSGKLQAAHIMAWMGHKDLKTTMRYTHLVHADLVVGADALAHGFAQASEQLQRVE